MGKFIARLEQRFPGLVRGIVTAAGSVRSAAQAIGRYASKIPWPPGAGSVDHAIEMVVVMVRQTAKVLTLPGVAVDRAVEAVMLVWRRAGLQALLPAGDGRQRRLRLAGLAVAETPPRLGLDLAAGLGSCFESRCMAGLRCGGGGLASPERAVRVLWREEERSGQASRIQRGPCEFRHPT